MLYQRGTGVVCFSFFFWLRVLDKAEYSVFESTLNSAIVSYCIVGCVVVQKQQTALQALRGLSALTELFVRLL